MFNWSISYFIIINRIQVYKIYSCIRNHKTNIILFWNYISLEGSLLSHANNLHLLHGNREESEENNDILRVACGVYTMWGMD